MAPPEDTVENGHSLESTEPVQATSPPVENGTSRFSDDDVDTEIEVTPDESSEKPRRKKKKSKDGDDETRETSEERKERKRKRREKKRKAKEAEVEAVDIDPPSYPSSEEREGEKPKKQKRNLKKQVNQLLDAPFFFAAGVLVCVLLPFSIYACDVIISVNVIDNEAYRSAVKTPKNNMTELPVPLKLVGEKYHKQNTLLIAIQINANPKNANPKAGAFKMRISRQAPNDEPSVIKTASDPTPVSSVSTPTDPPASTESIEITSESSATTITTSTTSSSTSSVSTTTTGTPKSLPSTTLPTNATNLDSNETITINGTFETTTFKPRNTTRKKPPLKYKPRFHFTTLKTTTPEKIVESNVTIDPVPWQQQDGDFCKGLFYFYNLHVNYERDYGSDWFDDQTASVYQKEQTLFFLFTIIGFISLLIGLGLRCDVFLSDEWSSFILVNLFLYSISMAVTVSVFAQESGEGGLRCATCRFTTGCADIDPWDYRTHWPADPDNMQWSMVALISFILKLVDCYAIAIVTLKFILDLAADLWWVTCLKVFGWLLVFPMLIFTPMLGVMRYQALPATAPNDAISRLTVEVFFYIGVVFWGICLITVPFFCKMRMCSGSEAEEKQEEEDEMYK